VENGVPATQAQTALRELGFAETPETFTRTDSTEMCLGGGEYQIEVAATFSEGGIVGLYNSDGDLFATFTENGSATVTLSYGDYKFDGANFSDLVASVTG
jgi:hypothetical protein